MGICHVLPTFIYPEKNQRLPESLQCRIIFQDGSEHLYQIPTVRIQSYSLQEIHEKKIRAENDALRNENHALRARSNAELTKKDAELAEKERQLAEKNAELARMKELLDKYNIATAP